ncbi:MAG TPA: carbamoyl-phosphate synthase large subunit [Tepidisphaeraceae bacterium]|nr:carbamoyl-phosphate synthase large subunit [Tepidisphaeraceae bacterium]
MPKRTDIHSILIIGSGPIVIGQGCEFDYSGVQACRALREEGYRVVLMNSNPATIMTDPEFADATYIEPITPETVEKILVREKQQGTPVDALLPTLGGQTGLNTGMACWDKGILQKHGVQMIGADREAIYKGEDRQVFKDLMLRIGLNVPRSGVVHTMDEARKVLDEIGLPLIIRPAFTLGGTGGGIAYNVEEFEEIVTRGLDASPVTEVLIEQSVIGWKEFEMEVVRDRNDNCIIICSIENIDAMGVHTGDSITVAPIQTLTDKEYQRMRDASFAVIRAVGVETGGSNIQFAINPDNGDMVVVEMNPRVSRSSALASKATGYPIAKIAAKLAVGYTLDELPNPITSTQDGRLHTSACFEPTIDYVVVKIPRWTFEKFPDADETLTTQMKSVGEAMAIGRTFKEALQKGIRSMEVKRFGFGLDKNDKWLSAQSSTGFQPVLQSREKNGLETHATVWPIPEETLRRKLAVPSQGRLYYVRYALKMGWSIEQIHELTHIDPWFLGQMKELTEFEGAPEEAANHWSLRDSRPEVFAAVVRGAKEFGYSDVQLANLFGVLPGEVRKARQHAGVEPVFKLVDTCAAEFEASTPYYYSTYETPFASLIDEETKRQSDEVKGAPGAHSLCSSLRSSVSSEDEIRLTDKPKIVIIGGGPNRIGQGIEFDYCCVQAAFAVKELGFEAVMINSNPETVSTDYDTSDLLFFEPLTHEDVLNVCERVNGSQFNSDEATERRSDEGKKESAVKPSVAPSLRRSVASGLVKGVIVQLGGQTPLNLARGLHEAGVPLLGTSIDSLDRAGDREQFRNLLQKLGLKQPPNGIARTIDQARAIAKEIGYPVLVRPSFVLGGRAMEIVSDEEQLNHYMAHAVDASTIADAPILVDKFLDNADECDLDVIADYGAEGTEQRDSGSSLRAPLSDASVPSSTAIVIGVMEHIEEAGIHSGDSACVLPPYTFSKDIVAELKRQAKLLAKELRVCGLMNVQFAIKDGEIYVIEVNPRASRTVPFVGKATGIPWARIAAKIMAGKKLTELGYTQDPPDPKHVSVKEVVFPFSKFPGVDIILGPEMRSTGEVMGIDATFDLAFAKAQLAAGTDLPLKGAVYISVRNDDKELVRPIAQEFARLGFQIICTEGTRQWLAKHGIKAERVSKLAEGRPNISDLIKNGNVQLVINTPTRKGPATDEGKIRALCVANRVPIFTTLTAAEAAARAIGAMQKGGWDVKPLQAYHASV